LNEKGSALRLGAATQLVVGRIGAWNIGQYILATGEVGHF